MEETTEQPQITDRSWVNPNSGIFLSVPAEDTPPSTNDTQAPTNTDAPPAQTDTPPVVIPFEDKWKSEFGDVDIATVKERYSQFDTVYKENETLKSATQVPTYKTEGGKQIDEWLAKGVKLETIARFGNIKDATELAGEQAIKLKMEIENPTWDASIIDAYYKQQYKHEADELKSDEINAMEETLKRGAVLKAEAEAKGFLKDYLGKQFNPSVELDTTAQAKQEAIAKASQFWTGQANVISNATKQVTTELRFKVMGEKGQEEVTLPVNYVVPEAELKQLTDFALQSAVNGGVELTEKGVASVNDYVQGLVWAKYGKNIVNAAVQDALSRQEQAFRKTIHNPTVAGVTTQNMGNISTSRMDAFRQKLANS